MGVLGLAIESTRGDERGANIGAFLAVGRSMFSALPRLVDGLTVALEDWQDLGLDWLRWETADVPDSKAVSVRPEDYPIAYFTVRALELLVDGNETIRLGGRASWITGIVAGRLDGWAGFATVGELGPTLEQRKTMLLRALGHSVALNEQAEEDDIIAKPLDAGRIEKFVADLYFDRIDAATIEFVFARAGRAWWVDPAESTTPLERGIANHLTYKAPFTDTPNWAELDPREFAIALEQDLVDC